MALTSAIPSGASTSRVSAVGLPGSTAGVVSRSDGLDFAFLFNLDLSNSARADIRDSINRQLDMLRAEL